ncbi:MAG: hypothetical protein C0410_08515, partial [Anaerolinea sp.]|nr:hypothetical protein [Anaerolinea sp.]
MMKNQSKKIISIMLMAGFILAAIALALPNATGIAATNITATTPAIEQSGLPGATLYFPITIANGDSASADLTVVCELSGAAACSNATVVASITPPAVSIGAGSSAAVMVAVQIPSTATVGSSEVLSIRIKASGTEVSTISLIVHVVGQTAGASDRPQLNITSYNINAKYAKVGTVITLTGVLENRGPVMAFNN